jgi:PTH2 family peptidyl-tRNA hydrolase
MNEKTYPVMYIFVNKSLNMSPGKLAAQACHASCNAMRISNAKLVDDWYEFGFYTKLVMEARDEQHLRNIEKYLNERDIKTALIIDEGRTEIPKHSVTALGCEVVDKNVLGPIFQEFDLFKPELTIKVKWE